MNLVVIVAFESNAMSNYGRQMNTNGFYKKALPAKPRYLKLLFAMRTNYFLGLLPTYLLFLTQIAHAQQLKTFSAIPGRDSSTHYSCRVRLSGSSTWQKAFVLQTTSKTSVTGPERIDPTKERYTNGYIESLNGWTASWIAFEFAKGEVEVEISQTNGKPIRKAMVRPVGDAKPALIRNGKVYVTFTKHANVNVDIDGQMEDQSTGQGYKGQPVHTICLFGNRIFPTPTNQGGRVKYLNPGDSIPNSTDWDTLSFQPGVHRIFQYIPKKDGTGTDTLPFYIRDNLVIHIPGDAVVHGTFMPNFKGGNNEGQNYFGDGWTVYGSGTISGEEIPHWRTGSQRSKYPFKGYATKIRLEGFVVADAAEHHFNVSNKTSRNADSDVNIFKNLKTLAWRLNTDGGAMQRNTITSDCFFRLQDDLLYCCQAKSRLNNCVFWTDTFGCLGVFLTDWSDDPANNPIRDIKYIYGRRNWHAGATSGVKFRDARLGITMPPYTISNVKVEDPFPSYGLFDFYMLDDNPNSIDPAPVFSGTGITFENFVQQNHACIEALGVVPHNKMRSGHNKTSSGHVVDTLLFSNITFKNFAYLRTPTTSFTAAKFTGKAGANVNFVLDCNNITNGGRIGANQAVGSATAPDPIVGETELDANGGVIEYVWVKSTTDSNPTLMTGQIICRATDPIYYPGVLAQTTHFRRFARRAGCTDYLGSENTTTITVCNSLTNGGTISGNQELCNTKLSNVTSPSGGSGSIEYIWLSSTTGCPTSSSSGEPIMGATDANYSPGLLTQTTYFRRFARNAGCTDFSISSNCVTVETDKTPPVFTSTPRNITKTITRGSSAVVTYATPTVTDNCGTVTVSRTGLASGSEFPVGVTTITYIATDASGNASRFSFTITVVNTCQNISYTSGSISLMRWSLNTIPKSSFPIQIPNRPPNVNTSITSTDGVWNIRQDRYVTRVFGYIVAPTTGDYKFNVTGDDRVELYLSPTCSVQDTSRIAFTSGPTSRFEFTNSPTQTSKVVSLTKGSIYYFELRQLEITGNDGWSIYWQTSTEKWWRSITSRSLARLPNSLINPIPTSLDIELSAKAENSYAHLEWTANNSTEADHFEVQRLDNTTGEYQVIAVSDAHNTVDKPGRLSILDKKPIAGKNYYRIKMIDTSGNSTYSPVEMVQFGEDDGKEVLVIYPNPTDSYFIIDLKSYSGKAVSIYLYNSIGQQIQHTKIEKVVGNVPTQLNVSALPSGNYLIRVTTPNEPDITRKVQVIR